MDVKFKDEKTSTIYFDVRTCQNSDEKYICSLRNDGIELPISESGECRVQFCQQNECSSFY